MTLYILDWHSRYQIGNLLAHPYMQSVHLYICIVLYISYRLTFGFFSCHRSRTFNWKGKWLWPPTVAWLNRTSTWSRDWRERENGWWRNITNWRKWGRDTNSIVLSEVKTGYIGSVKWNSTFSSINVVSLKPTWLQPTLLLINEKNVPLDFGKNKQ